MKKHIILKLRNIGYIFNCKINEKQLSQLSLYDWCLIKTNHGKDIARIISMVCKNSLGETVQFVSRASGKDIEKFEKLEDKEEKSFEKCRELIQRHKLKMKLIRTHALFDFTKILFYFVADSRVDFRNLVKELASEFKTRIELRQIGVRDETFLIGGYGHCGRELCCHLSITNLSPISIQMAKEQNLTLNSTKISGVCGRLLCCLKYEEESYKKMQKDFPVIGAPIEYKGDHGYIKSLNFLTGSIFIQMDNMNAIVMDIETFRKEVSYKPPKSEKELKKIESIDEDLILEE